MAGAVSASLAVWRGPASHLPQDTSACTPSGTVCRQRFHDSMAVLPCAASVCLEAGRGFVLKGASRCRRHARPSVASCRADLQADAMGTNVAKDGQGRPGCTVGKVGKGAMVASALSALVSTFGRSGPSGFLPVARALSLACHETSPCLDLGLELGGASCPPPRDLSVGHTLPGGKFRLPSHRCYPMLTPCRRPSASPVDGSGL